MNRNKLTGYLRDSGAALLAMLVFAGPAGAQVDHIVVEEGYEEAEAQPADTYAYLSSEELEELVAPIALYPDDLVSIVLPAATYPVQVVQAARFLEDRRRDSSLEPADDWDDAVVALLNYPEVIEMMNDDLDWTWAVGEAFLNQQAEVMDAIGEFRDRAYAAGNLRSDEHQVVTRTREVIEIAPADPEVIYVPYYEPARVVVYQPYPVYYYHPFPRYSYYYPYPASYAFSYGYFFGVTTAYRLHWSRRHLYTYHHWHHAHPYYGRGYHARHYFRHRPYYRRLPRHARSRGGYRDDPNHRPIWRPRPRHGSRPHSDRIRPRHGGEFAGSTSRGGRNHGADRPRRPRPGNALPGDGSPTGSRQGANAARLAPGDDARRARRTRPRNVYTDTDPDMRHITRRARRNTDAVQGHTSRPRSARASERRDAAGNRRSLGTRRPAERDANSNSRRPVRVARSQPRVSSGNVRSSRPRHSAVTTGAHEKNRRIGARRAAGSREPVAQTRSGPRQAQRRVITRPRSATPPAQARGASPRPNPAPVRRAAPQRQMVVKAPPRSAPRASAPPRQAVRADERPARSHPRSGNKHRAGGRRARP